MIRKATETKLKRYWYCLLGKELYVYKNKKEDKHKSMHSLVGVFIKDELFSVDGGMPPLVENSVEDIRGSVVASNSTRTISATDSVVPVGVAVCGAGCAVCASMGARARFENDVVHPSADADVKNGVRHVVAGGRGKLQPRPAM